jgi:hypothetical protein
MQSRMKPDGTTVFTFADAGISTTAFGELLCTKLRRMPEVGLAYSVTDYDGFRMEVRPRVGVVVSADALMRRAAEERAADVAALRDALRHAL